MDSINHEPLATARTWPDSMCQSYSGRTEHTQSGASSVVTKTRLLTSTWTTAVGSRTDSSSGATCILKSPRQHSAPRFVHAKGHFSPWNQLKLHLRLIFVNLNTCAQFCLSECNAQGVRVTVEHPQANQPGAHTLPLRARSPCDRLSLDKIHHVSCQVRNRRQPIRTGAKHQLDAR